jgi:hypothetical protein
MRAAWHCGSVAPIRADAALQGCAAFRIALLAPLLGAAPVKALPIWRGTGSSNLSPSSGESIANLASWPLSFERGQPYRRACAPRRHPEERANPSLPSFAPGYLEEAYQRLVRAKHQLRELQT